MSDNSIDMFQRVAHHGVTAEEAAKLMLYDELERKVQRQDWLLLALTTAWVIAEVWR